MNPAPRHTRFLIAALFATLLCPLHPARASKGDAHDEAMALAEKSRKGFKVREDFWSGTCKPDEKKTVKIQLFKGNEYWFWLGIDEDFGDISFDVFDTAGNKVSSEATSSDLAKGVRITPARTGTYVAVFTLTLKPTKGVYQLEVKAVNTVKVSRVDVE